MEIYRARARAKNFLKKNNFFKKNNSRARGRDSSIYKE
tara:strand:+ start:277 stop:390 length:114 start_codon:yes stop_codon:yes gene_type:complete